MKYLPSESQIDFFQKIRYVFLDRDGVINRKAPEGQYVSHWSDFEILPGVESALAALHCSGRRIIIVTNQRGIALGLYTCADVETLHNELQRHLARHGACIDALYYCPHDRNQCECRKPKTGLFHRAFRDFPGASPLNSLLIGDSLSDIEAANQLGMPSIFISGSYARRTTKIESSAYSAARIANSLEEAARLYLK